MAIPEQLRELSPGRRAYEQAQTNLVQPNCMPQELRFLYPDRVFNYGEHGYGVALPGNLVFYSYENGDGIMTTERKVQVEDGWPKDYGNWFFL